MILVLGLFNLASCVVIAVTGTWLLADRGRKRGARAFLGVITCGAVVNVVALAEALSMPAYLTHAFVWPSEAMVNFGAAVMMIRRCRGVDVPRTRSGQP